MSGWCKGENWRNNNLEWKIEYSVKQQGKNGIVSSRISALNVIKVWAVKQSITDIGTRSIN